MLLQYNKKYVLITKIFSKRANKVEQDNIKRQETPQEATTVGMFLRYTRQNQKKSIETVSKALCIRKVYINAIEESDFKELPPVPYGIGFVRSYADFLGLNVERIVQCYKEETMPKKNINTNEIIIKKHTALTIPNRKHILIGISLVLGLYFIVLAVRYSNNLTQIQEEISLPTEIEEMVDITSEENKLEENAIQPTIEQLDETEETKTEENEEIKETNKETKTTEETDNSEPTVLQPETPIIKNKVIAKFKGESWFEVKDNETVYISGTYKEGFEYELPDVPNLIISVGRYFNVDVFINDKLTQVAGPKKQTNINLDEFLNH